jgi:hypothetical protein
VCQRIAKENGDNARCYAPAMPQSKREGIINRTFVFRSEATYLIGRSKEQFAFQDVQIAGSTQGISPSRVPNINNFASSFLLFTKRISLFVLFCDGEAEGSIAANAIDSARR